MWNTEFYKNNWDAGNADFNFFDPNTFGMDIYDDPCTIINSNVVFKNKINEKINCLGTWCVDDSFNCVLHKTTECYNVEHIIDTNGNEFRNAKCKQIAGNMVMAYGRWNSQLGSRARKYYSDSINEKMIVYRQERVNNVRDIIIKCNPDCEITKSTQQPANDVSLDREEYLVLLTIFICLCIFIITCITYCICKYCIKKCCEPEYIQQHTFSLDEV